MMEINYLRNANGNYAVLEGSSILPVDECEYEEIMIQKNEPSHLLEMQRIFLDGRWQIQYKITGMQSLESRFEKKGIGQKDLRHLTDELKKALDECSRYLLQTDRISMDPRLIYINYIDEKYCFSYVPSDEITFIEGFRELLEMFILPKLNHSDRDAVDIAYDLYNHASGDGFTLSQWQEPARGAA